MAEPAPQSPVDLINVFVDTVNQRYFFFASACRPFGMVSLCPDTKIDGAWNSGYRYEVDSIRCFSHLHAWQMSAIPVLPTTGEMRGHLGSDVYKSCFSHDDEEACPGYHSVFLQDYGIRAELTSTDRVGLHRYTFPAGDESRILFDLGIDELGPCGMSDALARPVGDAEIEGFVECEITRRRPKATRVYFVARFDTPFAEFGGWEDGQVLDSPAETAGAGSGCFVRYATGSGQVVQMKVAISYCSIEQARLNLETELPHWEFDRVRRESRDVWNEWLSRIEIEGGTHDQRVRFYTDLWHALQGRRTVSDVDGRYLDMTGPAPVIRRNPLGADGEPRYKHYSSDAFWGAQWNLSILWSMVYPRVMEEFCNSLIDMYKNGGMIPRGPVGGNYSFVMSAATSTPFIVAAYMKGIRGFDIEAGYAGMRKNHFPGGLMSKAGYEHDTWVGGGVEYYIERGYIPEGIKSDAFHVCGATHTLEYCYEDWCLAQMARALGRHDDADLFMKRAAYWANLYDAESGYIRPRNMDGSWLTPFDPAGKPGFEESNSYIDTWKVSHDLRGLAGRMGGCDVACERLNAQFESGAKHDFVHERGEEDEQVNFGNQPGMGLAHVFSYLGKPWLTQKWVRQVLKQAFSGVTPELGYRGDEDQGQIGALGVLFAMGLFDVVGGAAFEPYYEVTAPIFDRVTIHLDPDYYRGRIFVIETANNTPENVYIQSAELNGEPLDRCWFHHADFASGGSLKLKLGPEPNTNWGSAAGDLPPSMTG